MLRLDRGNPNSYIGIILLVVLLVFVLPERLQGVVAELSPFAFGGIPCGRLPAASSLAAHQSILGRSAKDPLQLELSVSEIGEEGELALRLMVTNLSLGTLPIVYQEENIVVAAADDESNGFGMIVDPAPAEGVKERSDSNPAGYVESDVRFLGPRQRCTHAVAVIAAAAMIADGGTAQAWYRMTTPGEHLAQQTGTRLIYPDQGLAILSEDVVFSDVIMVPPRAQA